MAALVEEALKGPMERVMGRLNTALIEIGLPFVAHTKEQFEKEANGSDPVRARLARRMVAAYEARNEPRQMPYPVQVVRFDEGLALVALGGEAGPGCAKNIHKLLHNKDIVVVLNANEGAVIVPSPGEPELCATGVALLSCAGEYSMLEFGWPGWLTGEADERIADAVQRAWKRSEKR